MEVIDNSKQLNDSEEINQRFNCRLSRNFLHRPNSSNPKNQDSEVAFLLRCKFELSSEVINQKTENVRLQKLCEIEQRKTKEINQKYDELSKRNQELEAHLMAMREENHQLKIQSLSFEKENSPLNKKIRQGIQNFHSFPWTNEGTKETSNNALRNFPTLSEDELNSDGWKEVSQKILAQMKQEMKEYQEIRKQFVTTEEKKVCEPNEENSILKQVEEGISDMMHETSSLKTTLLKQREKLHSLMLHIKYSNLHTEENQRNKIFKNSHTKPITYATKITKLSDETFRDYFTKQLESHNSGDEMNKMMQMYLKSIERENSSQAKKSVSSSQTFVKERINNGVSKSNENCEKTATSVEDERICPICEAVFPKIVSQKEFEAHVVDHLETESASLLDQYVVL